MPEPDMKELVRQAPFSFVGKIEHLGAATSSDLPIDDRTAVAMVEWVLHAPPAFEQLAGQRITVQFSPDLDLPEVDSQLAIFAEGLAFGETIAVAEVGRAPVETVVPYIRENEDAGPARAFATIERELRDEALRDHAEDAAAVVVGTVVGLEVAGTPGGSEHDPLWWRATIDVSQVVRGRTKRGALGVLYPSSFDIEWAQVPKPAPAENALWILHRTPKELAGLGRYQLLHPEDRQPVEMMTSIRRRG